MMKQKLLACLSAYHEPLELENNPEAMIHKTAPVGPILLPAMLPALDPCLASQAVVWVFADPILQWVLGKAVKCQRLLKAVDIG